MLINLNVPIVNNKNISRKHLGYNGLHLNSYFPSRLAMNLISVIKKLWNDASYPTDSLDYKYSEAKKTNPNTNIYSYLEQSSTNNISFIDENEESSESTSFLNKLKATRIANINRLMIGHININSIRNKFEMLSNSIKGNLDILMISETKLDSTFPSNQFTIEGYAAPIRFDRNGRGGGIILYIREDIPARLLKTSLPKDFEGFFVELNLRKKKILMCCSYNPAKSNISSHLSMVGRSLDSYMSSYDNFLVIGDLNSEISEMAMSEFCETYNLQNLVKDPTCYKNPSKPTCIDLILTNFPKSFQHTQTIETGLSDFHKLTLTVLKTHFPRLKPNIVNYRDYKGFVNDYFRSELLQEINSSDSDLINFKDLQYTLQRALDKHAPLKKRYVRANQQNFMDKELNQAIMVRSKLRNKYLKSK